jgi:FkbM family methyltransferase
MRREVVQWVRENRRMTPLRWAGTLAEKYLHAYYNENFWDFEKNGEMFAVTSFRKWLGDREALIWDVGANAGQWAIEAQHVLPDVELHSFEIVPRIYNELVARTSHLPNVHAHDFGLSDRAGEVTVHFNPELDVTSSIVPRLGHSLFHNTVPTPGQVCTADEVAKKIGVPTLLKIDTEGHELCVLTGAQKMLASQDGPVMLQIEYAETYIPVGATMKAVYELVEPHGYSIGRLHPNHVDFKPYSYDLDTFRSGNLIASKDPDLTRLLSGRRA